MDVMAIAAHPDDVEQTCGGTLIRMAEKGYRTFRAERIAGAQVLPERFTRPPDFDLDAHWRGSIASLEGRAANWARLWSRRLLIVLMEDAAKLCPHNSSVIALTLRVETPCTYIPAKPPPMRAPSADSARTTRSKTGQCDPAVCVVPASPPA